jgi:hypothetical protein
LFFFREKAHSPAFIKRKENIEFCTGDTSFKATEVTGKKRQHTPRNLHPSHQAKTSTRSPENSPLAQLVQKTRLLEHKHLHRDKETKKKQ